MKIDPRVAREAADLGFGVDDRYTVTDFHCDLAGVTVEDMKLTPTPPDVVPKIEHRPLTRAYIRIDRRRIMFYAHRDARILDLTAADLNYAIDNCFIELDSPGLYIFTKKGRTYLQQLKDRQHAEVETTFL